MANATGGCLCGAVRYEVSADPVFQFACHCTECQRANGGSPSLGVAVPEGALAMTKGAAKDYVSKGDSGGAVTRSFCAECGAPLFSKPEVVPGLVMIKIGSLDDPSAFKPQVDMFMASARPWHAPHEGAAQFERGPG